MPVPVAIHGSMTPPLYGPSGVVLPEVPTVLVEGLPLAVVTDPVTPHGNPNNPKAPGFNPMCGHAFITQGAPTVLAHGLPVAHAASELNCGYHMVALNLAKTVYIGIK